MKSKLIISHKENNNSNLVRNYYLCNTERNSNCDQRLLTNRVAAQTPTASRQSTFVNKAQMKGKPIAFDSPLLMLKLTHDLFSSSHETKILFFIFCGSEVINA